MNRSDTCRQPNKFGFRRTLSIALILMIVPGAYYAVKVRRLRSKVLQTPDGEEAVFTKWEAKLVEKIMRSATKSHSFLWKTLMKFMGNKSAPT
jgi:hypothetical protein